MTRIIDKQGTGKTKKLMLAAKESGGTIVCSNPDAVRNKSYAYGLTGIDFISYHDYLNPYVIIDAKPPFYIDELENFLLILTGRYGRIDGYSLTMED